MVAKIIIKREISEGKEKHFFFFMKIVRPIPILSTGRMSGQSLIRSPIQEMVIVISKWESLEAWNSWKSDIKRQELDARLNDLQDNPTIYEPYIFGRYKTANE